MGRMKSIKEHKKVVSDPSSASFFIVGSLISPGSKIILKCND